MNQAAIERFGTPFWAWWVACAFLGHPSFAPAAPATRPAQTQPEARRVELTLLGKTSDIKGLKWPVAKSSFDIFFSSVWIEEPCDLTLHLPGGRTLNVRTRPVLIVSQSEGFVVTVQFPPAESKPAWLSDHADEMAKLLGAWHAIPSKHMLALIDDYKKTGPPGPNDPVFFGGIERVGGAKLDDHAGLLFELSSVGGKWSMTAVIGAEGPDRDRIFRMSQARMHRELFQTAEPATQP